jgi:hypothetical protein
LLRAGMPSKLQLGRQLGRREVAQIDDPTLERWRSRQQEHAGDSKWVRHQQQRDGHREDAIEEMIVFLGSFLQGAIDVEQFRSTFDVKTRNEWDYFGFKGLSGAMFLNKLVKHLSDRDRLAAKLREALPVPASEDDARRQMRTFSNYLEERIQLGVTNKQKLQPARAAFFLSAFWHIQSRDEWPVYYQSARRTLEREKLFKPEKSIVEDYFRFRSVFLTLARRLELPIWEFEHLCAWMNRQADGQEGEKNGGGGKKPKPPKPGPESKASHTEIQGLLARMGRKLGCSVWIASNDHSKTFDNGTLGELSIEQLPNFGIGDDAQKIIGLIDVLWLSGKNKIAAAFEVEHSTSIYSGLLRLSDLTVASPNLSFPLYIVAPSHRIKKVARQLRRPTFQSIELNARCGFFSDEELLANAENILKWSDDPAAIDKLAHKVPDRDA